MNLVLFEFRLPCLYNYLCSHTYYKPYKEKYTRVLYVQKVQRDLFE